MVAASRCVRPQCQWYQLAYATEMKSIQLHDSIEGLSQKIVSITLHYITLHITLHTNRSSDRDYIRLNKFGLIAGGGRLDDAHDQTISSS